MAVSLCSFYFLSLTQEQIVNASVLLRKLWMEMTIYGVPLPSVADLSLSAWSEDRRTSGLTRVHVSHTQRHTSFLPRVGESQRIDSDHTIHSSSAVDPIFLL